MICVDSLPEVLDAPFFISTQSFADSTWSRVRPPGCAGYARMRMASAFDATTCNDGPKTTTPGVAIAPDPLKACIECSFSPTIQLSRLIAYEDSQRLLRTMISGTRGYRVVYG